jgi:purine-nucleoside phosphorylase
LGGLAHEVDHAVVIPYHEIPHMPRLLAAGHIGELIVGELSGCPVVLMRGRAHLYEGHEPMVATFGVRVLHAMGTGTLVVSNAAGGLNPRFAVGDLVLMDGHINLMHANGFSARERNDSLHAAGNLRRVGPLYDPDLIRSALDAAHKLGFGVHRGVYLATLGPTYETRAEYRMFRRIGADMTGMSTVPEAILAASLGMKVLAFSVITNMASPDSLAETSHEDVLSAAQQAQAKLTDLLRELFSSEAK